MSQTAALYHLQALDNQIDETRSRLAEIHRLLNEDAVVLASRAALEASEQARQVWQKKQSAFEHERERLQDEATTTEQRLYSGQVFNPRELSDLQVKLAELNHRREASEEPALEAMIAVDELGKEIIERQNALNQALAQRAAEAGTLANEQTALTARLADMESQAKQARATVESAGLSLYDKLRRRPGGSSVVMIKGAECGGCGVELTSQMVQQARRGEVSACPTCGRILYI